MARRSDDESAVKAKEFSLAMELMLVSTATTAYEHRGHNKGGLR